jgi:hypothetical protein
LIRRIAGDHPGRFIRMHARVPSLVTLLVATLLTGACTVIVPADRPPVVDQPRPAPTAPATDVPRPRPSPVLPSDVEFVAFEVGPQTIYPDSVIYFRFQVRRGGYLTVSALAPDGRVAMLARDVQVGTGPRLYPEVGSDLRIQASAPAGVWRVRAEWTPQPTGARYTGVRGLDAWTAAIAANLAGVSDASVAEAAYEVLAR